MEKKARKPRGISKRRKYFQAYYAARKQEWHEKYIDYKIKTLSVKKNITEDEAQKQVEKQIEKKQGSQMMRELRTMCILIKPEINTGSCDSFYKANNINNNAWAIMEHELITSSKTHEGTSYELLCALRNR